MTKQASPAFDTRPRVAVLMPAEVRSRIFPQQAEGALNAFAHPVFVSDEDLVSGALANALRDVTAVITGWLSPTLSHLLAPQGDIVFVSHAAGSVKRLDVEQALVDGHIRVSHSAPEIALAVAEFTLAQILAHLRLHTRQDAGLRGTMGWAEMRKGYLGQLLAAQTVGLVGLGYVGRLVLDRLRPFGCKVAVYDPFISTEEAERLGVTLMELDTLFASCPVVSLHAANLPATEGMITRSHLHAMVDGSLLVNTASIFEDDSLATGTRTSWDRAMETNLRAPFVLTQALAAQAPDPVPDDRGEPLAQALVVNMIDQRVRKPTPAFASYTIAKMGLWALTRTAAQGLAPRVRVNAIGPGPTLRASRQSEDHFRRQRASLVLDRGSNPADITGALRYFIGAPSVTGQLLCTDGGQHLAWKTPDIDLDP